MAGVLKKGQNNAVAACAIHTTNQHEMVINKDRKMDADDMF